MSNYLVTDKKTRPVAATISIIAAVVTVGYMLPWMIAALRGKSNHWGVFALNLLLGWTFIGWLVALVMACTSHQVAGFAQPVVVNNHLGYQPRPNAYPAVPATQATYPASAYGPPAQLPPSAEAAPILGVQAGVVEPPHSA